MPTFDDAKSCNKPKWHLKSTTRQLLQYKIIFEMHNYFTKTELVLCFANVLFSALRSYGITPNTINNIKKEKSSVY